jgi:hypothetical protein
MAPRLLKAARWSKSESGNLRGVDKEGKVRPPTPPSELGFSFFFSFTPIYQGSCLDVADDYLFNLNSRGGSCNSGYQSQP